jgi:hypothetical protein
MLVVSSTATPKLAVTLTCGRPSTTTGVAPTSSRQRSATFCCPVDVRVGQQRPELFAPQPRDHVGGAQREAQALGRLLQHDVAHGVAVLVVDALEVVEVDHDAAQRPTVAR